MARGDRIALAGMLSLLLGACSLAPTYKLQPVQTTADFQGVGPWRQAAPADALPRGAWWEVFGNPELNDLEQRVGKSNATLAAALARLLGDTALRKRMAVAARRRAEEAFSVRQQVDSLLALWAEVVTA